MNMNGKETIRKLDALCGSRISQWRKKAEWRMDNRFWLEKSEKVALSILNAMNGKGISREELAGSLGISVDQLHKYLSGDENMDLKTICLFEKTLGIDIIEINL